MNIHNYERTFERTLERIAFSDMCEANKKHIVGFKDYLLSEGIGIAKINRYLGDLLKFNRLFPKDFKEATKEDIRRIVSIIQQEPLSEETKRCFKIMLRRFYCYLRGFEEKGVYPDEVKWMKMELGVKHRKLPEELITEDEAKAIVQACSTMRDKALIACLAESGCRISEIGIMKIKHIAFEEYGARLSVTGKTGSRKILIINSAQYLQEWINTHPSNINPESYLWCTTKGELLTYNRITAILKNAARNAGVKKRIHAHLLRHSRATQLASIMSDAQMKNYLGWTQSSKMAGIYVHLSGKDADDAILKANNIEIPKERKDPKLKPLLCMRCKSQNPATHKFCNKCGFVLNKEAATQVIAAEGTKATIDTIMNALMQDKRVLDIVQEKMKEIQI